MAIRSLDARLAKLLGGCIMLVLGIGGCASVPLADKDIDREAKSFAVKAGLANIYVYRTESIGSAIAMPVVLDGVIVGKTVKKTYLLKQVHPGRHTIVSKSENDATLDVVAVAGQNYFIWQEMKLGTMKAGSKLHLVEDAIGKKAIQKCKLID